MKWDGDKVRVASGVNSRGFLMTILDIGLSVRTLTRKKFKGARLEPTSCAWGWIGLSVCASIAAFLLVYLSFVFFGASPESSSLSFSRSAAGRS